MSVRINNLLKTIRRFSGIVILNMAGLALVLKHYLMTPGGGRYS